MEFAGNTPPPTPCPSNVGLSFSMITHTILQNCTPLSSGVHVDEFETKQGVGVTHCSFDLSLSTFKKEQNDTRSKDKQNCTVSII